MIYRGRVQNKVVVFDEEPDLPEGTEVLVNRIQERADGDSDSLLAELRPFIGCIKDLPEDFAKNHDHYIHGTPKLR